MLNYERFCPITLNYEGFWLSALNHKWFCAYYTEPQMVLCIWYWTIQNVWWAVLNPKGSVLWMRNLEGFCRSMLNHRRLSIRLYRTKKVLSANAEPCRVLSIKFRTIEIYLFNYTEPKRFCRQMLNLAWFCRQMLNLAWFCRQMLNLAGFCRQMPNLAGFCLLNSEP